MIVYKTAGELRESGNYDLFLGDILSSGDYDDLQDDERFDDFLGGSLYVIEDDEDYREALNNVSNVWHDPENPEDTELYLLDVAYRADENWRVFALCTNDGGGNSYYISEKHFLESELTQEFMSGTNQEEHKQLFEGVTPR